MLLAVFTQLTKVIQEKKKISDQYCCGIYGFKNAEFFMEYAEKIIQKNERINNAFYFSQVYKMMLEDKIEIVNINITFLKSRSFLDSKVTTATTHISHVLSIPQSKICASGHKFDMMHSLGGEAYKIIQPNC